MIRPTRYLLYAMACHACQGSSGSGLFSGESEDDQFAAVLLTSTAAGTLCTTGGLLTTDETAAPPSLWLQDRRDIEVAIARGNGPWIEDLASEISLPEGLLPHLGAALQAKRAVLSQTLQSDVKALIWEKRLGQVLCCDPWIRPFARARFRCNAEPGGCGE